MSSLHWEWTKTLHQLLKKVVKWISGSETIVTDCVCSSWEEKKNTSVLMNKCTSPPKILLTERKSVQILTTFRGIFLGWRGLLFAKFLSAGKERRQC